MRAGEGTAAGQGRPRVRAGRHRRVRRGPVLRRLRRVRQGLTRRHPHPYHRRNRGPRRRSSTCCRRSGSATPGPSCRVHLPRPSLSLDPADGPGDACIAASEVRVGDPLTGADAVLLDRATTALPGVSGGALHRERDQRPAPLRRRRTRRPYVKDGINDHVVSRGSAATVNPDHVGTKAAAHYVLTLAPAESRTVRSPAHRRRPATLPSATPSSRSSARVAARRTSSTTPCAPTGGRAAATSRRTCTASSGRRSRACCGASSCTTSYAHRWLEGDLVPPSEAHRQNAMLRRWVHLYAKDVLSMPDAWEYPWFAAWDLAFHCVAVRDHRSRSSPRTSSESCWSMRVVPAPQRPDPRLRVGLLRPQPAGPRLGRVAGLRHRAGDLRASATPQFLERVLRTSSLMNFTWWVNEVDRAGQQHLRGRFPRAGQHHGHRSQPRTPTGQPIEQADGTALDGHVLPQHAPDLARAGRAARRCGRRARVPVQRRGPQVPAALHVHLRRDEPHRHRTACGTTRRASSWTARNHFGRLQVFSIGGPRPALRRRGGPPAGAEPGLRSTSCTASCAGSRATVVIWSRTTPTSTSTASSPRSPGGLRRLSCGMSS